METGLGELEPLSRIARAVLLDERAQANAALEARRQTRLFSGLRHYIKNGCETISLNRIGPRMIHGVASTPTVNSHKYSVSSRGCQAKLPFPVLSGHAQAPPVGEVVYFRKAERQIYVRAVIDEGNAAADYCWHLIESGETLAFSLAGRDMHLAGEVDGVKFYDRWRASELSICRSGANRDCRFEIYKGHT